MNNFYKNKYFVKYFNGVFSIVTPIKGLDDLLNTKVL